MSPNQIQKQIVLNAPRDVIWQAIGDSTNFGAWFGVHFEGPFTAGVQMIGRIVPTQVDPEVAKLQEPHTGMKFQIDIEEIDPPHLLAFRWHPFAIDSNRDYSKEPTTLVTFKLTESGGQTLLTITESGFEFLPTDRREQAFQANDGGWEHQTRLVEKFIAMRA